MPIKSGNDSTENIIINFLKKNKNFFIKNPELINELNFPIKDKSQDKIIDLGKLRLVQYSCKSSSPIPFNIIFFCISLLL